VQQAGDAATRKYGPALRRPVLIHGQFLHVNQVDGANRFAVSLSLFPMQSVCRGIWHREHTAGPVVVDDIQRSEHLARSRSRIGKCR